MTTRFKDFSAVARSLAEPQQDRTLLPELSAPAQQLTRSFLYQSYFDTTLGAQAILPQPPNQPIVPSTSKEEQIPGYGIGLHPSSQCPIAVTFRVGAQPSSSQPIVLKPGQIVRPFGLPAGKRSGSFSGFTWGLPFGWLGGGVATILVFQSPDASVEWHGTPEIIFHRIRLPIVLPASYPTLPYNWPLRFPWVQAIQGVNAASQQGSAQLGVSPTRTALRLRTASLGSASTMRMVFQSTNDMDLDSTGAVITTPTTFTEITWGSFAAPGGAGAFSTQYPSQVLDDQTALFGAENGGVALVDMSGGSLSGSYVDIVRYGRL